MSFASFSDFLSMGHHGPYVWSAYGLCLAILLLNVILPVQARRRFMREQARQVRREAGQ